ncbi:MAG: hypothetical protein HN736_02645 [Anaerolineae bacterium]|jgi:hypothetical protein|nr:hypothetical protein [Anaerolineae bacterium]
MSTTTQSPPQEKETPAQVKVCLPDVAQLSPQDRMRLDTAVMILVDYLLAASGQQTPKKS